MTGVESDKKDRQANCFIVMIDPFGLKPILHR